MGALDPQAPHALARALARVLVARVLSRAPRVKPRARRDRARVPRACAALRAACACARAARVREKAARQRAGGCTLAGLTKRAARRIRRFGGGLHAATLAGRLANSHG